MCLGVPCMHTCTVAHTSMHTHTRMHKHIQSGAQHHSACMHAHMHRSVCAHTYECTHTHTHTHTPQTVPPSTLEAASMRRRRAVCARYVCMYAHTSNSALLKAEKAVARFTVDRLRVFPVLITLLSVADIFAPCQGPSGARCNCGRGWGGGRACAWHCVHASMCACMTACGCTYSFRLGAGA